MVQQAGCVFKSVLLVDAKVVRTGLVGGMFVLVRTRYVVAPATAFQVAVALKGSTLTLLGVDCACAGAGERVRRRRRQRSGRSARRDLESVAPPPEYLF